MLKSGSGLTKRIVVMPRRKRRRREKVDRSYHDTWKTRSEALGDMEYADYLKSDEWRMIRELARGREYYSKCLKCGSKNNIELHHRSYKWIGTENSMRGIMPLCRKHHQEVHDYAIKNNVSVRLATIFMLREHKSRNQIKILRPDKMREGYDRPNGEHRYTIKLGHKEYQALQSREYETLWRMVDEFFKKNPQYDTDNHRKMRRR